MGRSLLILSTLEKALADPAQAAAMGQSMGFDLSRLPAGTDLFTLLGKLPADQLSKITAAINARFATLGDNMITQTAVAAVKAEYTALGMDTGKLQTDYIIHTGMLMLLVTLLSVTCTIVVGFLSARTARGLARDLRRNVFQRVESFSSTEFDKILHRLADHPFHQRHHPDPDGGHHDDAHGHLCPHHRRRRRDPRHGQERLHVVDHRPGGGRPARA